MYCQSSILAIRVQSDQPVVDNVGKSEVPSPDNRKSGSILSFVPAHGDSKAGAVAEQLSRTLAEGLGVAVLLADFHRGGNPLRPDETPRRLDGHTWGAIFTDRAGLEVMAAPEVHPRHLAPLLDHARQSYNVISADLTDARAAQTLEVLRASDSIFMVSDSSRASLEAVQEKMVWLRAVHLDDRCGLLLTREPGGVGPAEAEDITGLPVCSLVETQQQVVQLAMWLSTNLSPRPETQAGYALAG
jgi:hypothetical protein